MRMITRTNFISRLEDLSKFIDVQFEFKPVDSADPATGKSMEKLYLKIGGVEVIEAGDVVSKLGIGDQGRQG